MGRIDPAPQRPGRGPGSAAGWTVAGVLAIALAVLVAFQAGKRSSTGTAPAAHEPGTSAAPSVQPPASTSVPAAATVDYVSSPSPPAQRLESAVMEVTLPRPAAQAAPKEEPPPAPPAPETLHDKMARCLSFRVEDDDIHSPSRFSTRLLVVATNSCDFSFAGPEVWFDVRAIPRQGGGTSAREVGRFQDPIGARSRSETVIVLSCPECYSFTHRLEAKLSSTSGEGRTE